MQHPTLAWLVVISLSLILRATNTAVIDDSSNEFDCSTPQVLRLTWPENSNFRDPRFIDANSRQATSLLYADGLVRRGLHGTPELSLAESYTVSDDLKTYIFKIRERARWSDGKDITAMDIERNWTSFLESDAGAKCRYLFETARSASATGLNPRERLMITALDKKTLRVTLKKRIDDFLWLLCSPNFMLFKDYDEPHILYGPGPQSPVSGPFIYTKKSSKMHCLEKNHSYWDAENVKLDRIEIRMQQSSRFTLPLFINDEIDFVSYPFGEIDYFALKKSDTSQKSVLIHTEQAQICFWLELNTEDPLLKNIHLRKALSLAMNRSDLSLKMGAHKFKPAITFLPAKAQINPRYFTLNALPQQAAEFLDKAVSELDLPKSTIELEILTTPKEVSPSLSTLIAESLEESLGIKISIREVGHKEYLQRISEKKFQIAHFHWAGYSADPLCFLSLFRHTKPNIYYSNYTSWHNLNYIELLERAQQSNSEETRTKLFSEAERILLDEMPIIPLLECRTDWLQNPQLKNFVINEPNMIDFKWSYFD